MFGLFRTRINPKLVGRYYMIRSFNNVSVSNNSGKLMDCNKNILPSPTIIHILRMSTECCVKSVEFEKVKTSKDDKNLLLIDVRKPSELAETGVIPGSINIPLQELENVLENTTEEEFVQKYGKPKPNHNFHVVFSCLSGVRSAKAAQIAIDQGYKNVSNYKGGWMDWEKKSAK